MGIFPDTSLYGSQTLLGPGWPNIDEDALSAAAASFEALAMRLSGVVVPQLQGQMMTLAADWTGAGSASAMTEATAIINGHEVNATEASSIASSLRQMEAAVAKTKALANATAQRTQEACDAIESGPGYPEEKQAAIQSQVAMGLAQNVADVSAGTTELSGNLGTSAGTASQSAATTASSSSNPMQVMQMVMQMVSQVGQQAGKMGGSGQGLQQLTQPLQQLTSMFGKMGGSSGASVFSNHPLAGGAGPASGAGMVKAASVPGSGGGSAASPLMSNLVSKNLTASAVGPAEGASGGAHVMAAAAPVAAGSGGGMGGAGMAGARGTSGGHRAALAVPAPLDHDLTEDDGGEEW